MKRLLAVLVTLTLTLALAACGNAQSPTSSVAPAGDTPAADSPAPAAPASDAEPVELVVWESDKGPDEFIRQAGEKFTALYPNITIKYVHVEIGDAGTQIALDGPAGVGPDLFGAPHDKLGELVSGGHVLPTVNADSVKSKVVPAAAVGLTYDGTMYGYRNLRAVLQPCVCFG